MTPVLEVIAKLRDEVAPKLRGLTSNVQSSLGGLKDSFSSLSRVASGDLSGIADTVGGLVVPLGAVGVGIGAVAGYAVNAAIGLEQAALGFDKLSQKTGASVEFLSGFTQAADDVRVSSETVNTSLVKFAKTLQDTKGSSANVEAELMALADRFAGMADGPAKTALAMEQFGRAGAEMIPILNRGSEGIRGMMAEADKMGLVINDSAVASSKALAEQVDQLGDAFEGLKNRVGGAVMPALVSGLQAANGAVSELFVQMTIADGWVKMQSGAQMTQAELIKLKSAIDTYNGSMRGSSSMTDGMVDALAGVPRAATATGAAMIAASEAALRAAANTQVAMAMLTSAQGAMAAASAAAIKGTQQVLSSAYASQAKAYELKQKTMLQGQNDIEAMRAERNARESTNQTIDAANALLDEQAKQLVSVGGGGRSAAAGVKELTDAEKSLKDAQSQIGGELSTSLAAMDELARVQTAYALATGQLSAEQFAQQQAVKAVMQATKDKAISEDQAVATALALAAGVASTKDAYDIAGASGARFAEEQAKVQSAADKAGTKVKDMVTAIKGLPANTIVNVVATINGMNKIADVKRELLDLHERHTTTYVDVVYRSIGTAPPPDGRRTSASAGGRETDGGRASGGSVSAGNTYKVGEQGPEWFVPATNGAVVPDYRMRGDSAGVPIIIQLDGRTIARVVAPHLR